MKTGVYLAEFVTDDGWFVYVGSVFAPDFERRWTEHKKRLRKGRHKTRRFQEFWNKEGEENCRFLEWEPCPLEFCLEREHYWANHFASKLGRNHVLNTNLNILRGYFFQAHTDESREILRKKTITQWSRISPEERFRRIQAREAKITKEMRSERGRKGGQANAARLKNLPREEVYVEMSKKASFAVNAMFRKKQEDPEGWAQSYKERGEKKRAVEARKKIEDPEGYVAQCKKNGEASKIAIANLKARDPKRWKEVSRKKTEWRRIMKETDPEGFATFEAKRKLAIKEGKRRAKLARLNNADITQLAES